jgi:hypothetical protein
METIGMRCDGVQIDRQSGEERLRVVAEVANFLSPSLLLQFL